MSGPWEKYQTQEQGPWTKYQKTPPPKTVADIFQSAVGRAIENKKSAKSGGLLDETKRVFSSVNEDYLAGALGFPVDAANWLLKQVDLGSEKPVMGSDWLRDQSRNIGASQEGYRPETDVGRYIAAALGGAGAGAAGGALMGGGLMMAGQALPGTLGAATTVAGRASITPALDAAAGAGAAVGGQAAEDVAPGNQWVQAGGQLLGGLVGGALTNFKSAPENPALRAMDNLDISPTMGTAGVGGQTSAAIQNNVLAQTAFGKDVVDKAIDNTIAQVDDATKFVASRYGQAMPGPLGAGTELQKNLTDWFDQVKAGAGKVYDDIGSSFPSQEKFNAVKTLDALQNPVGQVDDPDIAKVLASPIVKEIRAAVEKSGGWLSYETMKQLRSRVGELMDPRTLTPDVSEAQLSKLYASLSDDIADAVATRGPDVLHRWRTTNALYANAMQKFKGQFASLVGKGGIVPPERAYKMLVGSAEGDFNRFRGIWNVLTPEQRGDYAATILMQMGRGAAGAAGEARDFSVLKFLRDFQKLSPQAKALLFRSTGNGEAMDALDDLVTVVAALKKNSEKILSTSRSNMALPMGLQFGAAGYAASSGDYINAALAALGPWALAKIMTNPAATRSLAFALKGLKAGGKAAAKAAAILQTLGLPDAQGQ